MIYTRDSASLQQFSDYKAARTPMVITDMMWSWPALTRWTDAYLTETCGEEAVEVMAWREADPLYEIQIEQHRTNMRFADYIAMTSKTASNDFYMTANNGFFRRPGAQRLFSDIAGFPFLANPRNGDNTFLWYGAGGTVTPLHYDTCDLILAQVRGTKQVIMVAPEDTQFLYNAIGVFSEVDAEKPDLDRHPLYSQAHKHVVYLVAGHALFIPQGWWHHVLALDTSISVSFTNLA